MTWPFGDLRPFQFDLLAIDPPVRFDTYSEKGEAKSPQAQYETMSWDELAAFPVNQLAQRDCWCFLWTCAPSLDKAMGLLKTWGFTYVSRITWRKVTKAGKPRMGPGYIVRTLTEDVLIGRCGSPAYAKALPSIFDGIARRHSEKPEEFYSLVEGFAPDATRLDMFSRRTRPGWSAFGKEAGKFDEVAA